MATTDLTFLRQADGSCTASFVSEGKAVVQMMRKGLGMVSVLANIPGMEPCVVDTFHNPYNLGIVFGVDLPVGIEVTIRCDSEIAEAQIMTEE